MGIIYFTCLELDVSVKQVKTNIDSGFHPNFGTCADEVSTKFCSSFQLQLICLSSCVTLWKFQLCCWLWSYTVLAQEEKGRLFSPASRHMVIYALPHSVGIQLNMTTTILPSMDPITHPKLCKIGKLFKIVSQACGIGHWCPDHFLTSVGHVDRFF